MNIACVIAYDGSRFNGFISGNPSLPSVKECFEKTLKRIGINSNIIASGRTDKHVHATYQVINFHTNLKMPLEKMKKLLNDRLYPHIMIRHVMVENDDFHARFSAKMRFYKYIFSDENISPFLSSYISRLPFGDVDKLRFGLGLFLGRHDFSMFAKYDSQQTSYIREIYKASLFHAKVHGIDCLVAHIGANGFLRAQIRIMLKACVDFSKDKISQKDLQRQIDNDISLKYPIRELAPPHGLYLSRVVY